jgi:hypothetical protein
MFSSEATTGCFLDRGVRLRRRGGGLVGPPGDLRSRRGDLRWHGGVFWKTATASSMTSRWTNRSARRSSMTSWRSSSTAGRSSMTSQCVSEDRCPIFDDGVAVKESRWAIFDDRPSDPKIGWALQDLARSSLMNKPGAVKEIRTRPSKIGWWSFCSHPRSSKWRRRSSKRRWRSSRSTRRPSSLSWCRSPTPPLLAIEPLFLGVSATRARRLRAAAPPTQAWSRPGFQAPCSLSGGSTEIATHTSSHLRVSRASAAR